MKYKPLRYAVTLVALLIAAARIYWPNLTIDGVTLGLLGIALFPWLQPLLKSIELPGVLKVEMQDYEQSTSETPPPGHQAPVAAAAPAPLQPYDAAARLKVLATLWRYQQQLFPNEPGKRWTFAVGPTAPDFPFYLRGIAQLVSEGLVAIVPQNQHCVLTNEGLAYCHQHAAELADADTYQF